MRIFLNIEDNQLVRILDPKPIGHSGSIPFYYGEFFSADFLRVDQWVFRRDRLRLLTEEQKDGLVPKLREEVAVDFSWLE